MATVIASAAPFVGRSLQNDMRGADLLDEVRVPPGAEELGVLTRVRGSGGVCRVFAGRVLATELTVSQLAQRTYDAQRLGLIFAWAEPGRFRAATWSRGELTLLERIPPPAEAALARWMILPDGVRRVVILREASALSFGEARCLLR